MRQRPNHANALTPLASSVWLHNSKQGLISVPWEIHAFKKNN